jgi:hypothetical protein
VRRDFWQLGPFSRPLDAALSQDQKSLIGHAGVDFGDNPMLICLDLLEVSSHILAILEKPWAEQAKFLFVDTNLNDGPLSLGTGTQNNPMPICLDLLEVSSHILAILEKPWAKQAKFLFVDTNLNDGPLSVGTGTQNNAANAWDLSTMIPAEFKDAAKYPVLVVIPTTLPLTYQEPPVGEMDDEDVQRLLQAIDNSALAWASAMENLIDSNNGTSLAEGKTADKVSQFFPGAKQADIKSMLGPPCASKQHLLLAESCVGQ